MFKSNKWIVRIVFLFIFLFIFLAMLKIRVNLTERDQIEGYRNSLVSFRKCEVEDILIGLREKRKIILYVGRETCPYCVKFLPGFVDLLQKNRSSIFECFERLYIDSTNSDIDLFLKAFRRNFLINSVPAILIFSDGEYESIELPLKDDYFDYQKIEQELYEYLESFKEEK